MAYDVTKEATIVISRPHHTMLSKVADIEGRKLKKQLELMIEKEYKHITNKTS